MTITDKHFKVIKYSLISLLIFFVFAILGVVYSRLRWEEAGQFFLELGEQFSFIQDFGLWSIFLFIFINNTITVFIASLTGVFLGVVSVFILIVNGFLLGVVSGYTYPALGFSGLFFSLAPHGIFEFPALFIGTGLGMNLGFSTYKEIKKGNLTLKKAYNRIRKLRFPSKKVKEDYFFTFEVLFKIVTPLLLVAALIEAYLIYFL